MLVRSPDAAALQMHMQAPASAATADMLLSPMPGTLLSLGVAAGAQVHALPCLTSQGEGVARSRPQRVKAHDVRSFHPGQVYAGQELCVVEAMKMQNVLTAPRDGVVKELLATAGSTLSADQAILSFEEATKAARA